MAKKGLGRGLDALYGEPVSIAEPTDAQSVVELKLMEVEPNREQPRTGFDEEKLEDLASSIREHGVIQPIIVHRLPTGFYQIVAGERRWRAAKKAGLKTIPAIVRDYDKMKGYEVALIENLQRQDLDPIEEALGYKKLMEEFSLTQEQISTKVSKSRSAVANSLRLLGLPKEVIDRIRAHELSTGHAKVLLSCEGAKLQKALAKRVVEDGLSVRELERLIKSLAAESKPKKEMDVNLKVALMAVEKRVAEHLSTKVKIAGDSKKGKIEISYFGNEDLERILKILKIQ
ncbi:MAG: ParB/RepB/Spo0J family partition protein [Ruminococcaceae bacterium]|nr:ParB/RepB/Spo0J family partition protein [Oscillospiraceae bacterium]